MLAAIAVLAPAWSQSLGYGRRNTRAVRTLIGADGSAGVEVDRLVQLVKRSGGGRVYAGMPSNWGSKFRVGESAPACRCLLRTADAAERLQLGAGWQPG